jgi:hypothetical protein
MCGAPATTVGFRDPGIFHTAVFTGLLPNQRVYYRFGDGERGVWSAEFSFLTPPLPGGDVSIIAFGDLGQAPVDDTIEQVPCQDMPVLSVTCEGCRAIKPQHHHGNLSAHGRCAADHPHWGHFVRTRVCMFVNSCVVVTTAQIHVAMGVLPQPG